MSWPAMAALTLASVELWHVSQVSAVPALMWIAVRLVPVWQPVPAHEAVTVVSWIGMWPVEAWHAVQLLSPVEIAVLTLESAEEWHVSHENFSSALMWIGSRLVPTWQPVPAHEAVTVVS